MQMPRRAKPDIYIRKTMGYVQVVGSCYDELVYGRLRRIGEQILPVGSLVGPDPAEHPFPGIHIGHRIMEAVLSGQVLGVQCQDRIRRNGVHRIVRTAEIGVAGDFEHRAAVPHLIA